MIDTGQKPPPVVDLFGTAGPPSSDDRPPAAPSKPLVGWPVVVGLATCLGGSVGFVIAFVTGAGNAWLGGSMALALLGVGVALAYWGRDLLPGGVAAEPYPVPAADPDNDTGLANELAGTVEVVTRRRFLTRLLVAALAVFGLSQVVLIAALGPLPGRSLFKTGWSAGKRLVTNDGKQVTRDTLATGTFLTAFPEGGTEAASSQVMLFRLPPGSFRILPGRETWSPEGYIAYSRVCTHAGCSVSQYLDQARVMACPCHQSTFDITNGAQPSFGPAGRPLPQLPLTIDAQGFLVAQSDFTQTVGPGFWDAG